MKISLLGGTGDIGEGLALRWAQKGHEIIIGSRKEEKARNSAEDYMERLKKLGCEVEIKGYDNAKAALEGDVVVLSIPYEYAASTLEAIKDSFTNQIVISPLVPMKKIGKSFCYSVPSKGSAAIEVRDLLPETVSVVSAYQNIAAAKLSNLSLELDYDVVVCGDDEKSKKIVMELTSEIPNLRALDGGPLENSMMVEAVTPLVISVAILNGMKNLSIKFTQ
jgi:hypothetical protein